MVLHPFSILCNGVVWSCSVHHVRCSGVQWQCAGGGRKEEAGCSGRCMQGGAEGTLHLLHCRPVRRPLLLLLQTALQPGCSQSLRSCHVRPQAGWAC